MNYTPEECKIICEMAYQYVYQMVVDAGKSKDEATQILERYKPKDLNYLNAIYEHFCSHVHNTKNAWGNSVKRFFVKPTEYCDNPWGTLGELLGNWNPHFVEKNFTTSAELSKRISEIYQKFYQGNYENYFNQPVRQFIIAIFELGHFFSQFENGEAVYMEFNKYYADSPDKLVWYLYQKRGIEKRAFFRMSMALLPDALKEMSSGYDYIKPDTHLNDIANKLGVASAQDFSLIADSSGIMSRYKFDKYLFLIGSGYFYKDDDLRGLYYEINNDKRKEELTQLVLDALNH